MRLSPLFTMSFYLKSFYLVEFCTNVLLGCFVLNDLEKQHLKAIRENLFLIKLSVLVLL